MDDTRIKLRDFLRDENQKLSMTRLVLLVITVIFGISAIVDIFNDVEIAAPIYDIIQTIFGFGLGGQALRTTVKNMGVAKQ